MSALLNRRVFGGYETSSLKTWVTMRLAYPLFFPSLFTRRLILALSSSVSHRFSPEKREYTGSLLPQHGAFPDVSAHALNANPGGGRDIVEGVERLDNPHREGPKALSYCTVRESKRGPSLINAVKNINRLMHT